MVKKKPGRPTVTAATSTHVLRSMVRSTTMSVAVTPGTSCGKALSSAQTEDPDACCGVSQLKVLRSDSAITKHLKSSEECHSLPHLHQPYSLG